MVVSFPLRLQCTSGSGSHRALVDAAAAKDLEIKAEITQSNRFSEDLRGEEHVAWKGPHLLRDAEYDERSVCGVKVGRRLLTCHMRRNFFLPRFDSSTSYASVKSASSDKLCIA